MSSLDNNKLGIQCVSAMSDDNKYSEKIGLLKAGDDLAPGAMSDQDVFYKYLKYISKFPILEKEEEVVLLKEYFENGDSDAGRKIVLSHLRLVVKIAMYYREYRGISMMDIISEGNAGLLYALKKFDYTKTNRFSTYATLWIRASIQDFILKSWSLVKVGSVSLRKALLLNSTNTKKMLGIEKTDSADSQSQKLADHFGVTKTEMENVRSALFRNETSLNAELSDSGNQTTLLDLMQSEDNIINEIEEEEETKLKMQAMKDAMSVLNERERSIIETRYLDDREDKPTLKDLSQKFGVSIERIRQIEESAIKKLQKFVQTARNLQMGKDMYQSK